MTKGYRSHRGPSHGRFFKILAVVVVLAVVLTAALLFLLQKYIVYNADGSVTVELPFFFGTRQPQQPSPAQSFVITTDAPSAPPPGVPSAPPETDVLRAVMTDAQNARAALEETGGNGVVLMLKGTDGALGYTSALELAEGAGISAPEGRNGEIDALAGETYAVAWMSCFRDHTMQKYRTALSMYTGSYRWLDRDGVGWLNPYKQEARDYIRDVAKEIASLGVDEIVLDYSGFPTFGKYQILTYGADADTPFSEAIDAFFAEVSDALEGTGVRLSAVTDLETLEDGENEKSGQRAETLLRYCDRLYVRSEDRAAIEAAYAAAGGEEAETRLVSVLSQAPGDVPYSYVVER